MRKFTKETEHYKIILPGEVISVGPGTVPTSGASVSQTSMKEMVSLLRKASREGIFDSDDNHEYESFHDRTK